jgi:hypothetical protein
MASDWGDVLGEVTPCLWSLLYLSALGLCCHPVCSPFPASMAGHPPEPDLSALSPSQLESVSQFRQVTNVDDVSLAVNHLDAAGWNVERAIDNVYDPHSAPPRRIEQLEVDDSAEYTNAVPPRSSRRGGSSGYLWIFALGRRVSSLALCISFVLC